VLKAFVNHLRCVWRQCSVVYGYSSLSYVNCDIDG
jgi:hypothetical protein